MLKIIPADERCNICHKRKAEYLCDMPIGRKKLFHLRKNGVIDYEGSFRWETLTCDRKMCAECAVEIGGDIHFCKECLDRVKAKVRGREGT